MAVQEPESPIDRGRACHDPGKVSPEPDARARMAYWLWTRETIVGLQEKLLFMLDLIQNADARPSTQASEAVEQLESSLARLLSRWETTTTNP